MQWKIPISLQANFEHELFQRTCAKNAGLTCGAGTGGGPTMDGCGALADNNGRTGGGNPGGGTDIMGGGPLTMCGGGGPRTKGGGTFVGGRGFIGGGLTKIKKTIVRL